MGFLRRNAPRIPRQRNGEQWGASDDQIRRQTGDKALKQGMIAVQQVQKTLCRAGRLISARFPRLYRACRYAQRKRKPPLRYAERFPYPGNVFRLIRWNGIVQRVKLFFFHSLNSSFTWLYGKCPIQAQNRPPGQDQTKRLFSSNFQKPLAIPSPICYSDDGDTKGDPS